MPKKIEPLEVLDTAEIPVVSVDIDTSYEALLPDPVPATKHVASATYRYNGHSWDKLPTSPRKFENLLPIASTIAGAIALGAAVLGVGVMLGAGI